MKITITHDFETIEDAQAFMERTVGGPPAIAINIPPRAVEQTPMSSFRPPALLDEEGPLVVVAKPARKPRSDAGRVRGPYKVNGVLVASAPGPKTTDVAPAPVPPATPPILNQEGTPSAAGVAESQAPAPSEPGDRGVASTRSAPSPSPAALTIDDARAALKRVNDMKGLGTPACIAHLQTFGVNRISDLPKEKYEEFILQADMKIAQYTEKA